MNTLRYKILKDYNLVLRYLKGQINTYELYIFIVEGSRDENYSSKYSVLYDIRHAEFLSEHSSVFEFAAKISKNIKPLYKRKIIFLTADSIQVIFASLIEFYRKSELYEIRVVSTLDTALDILNIDKKDYKYIKKNLSEMSV